MRKHKLISSLLAVAIVSSAIGVLPAMADDNPIVYTYTTESGKTVDITQSEIDAGHWNTAALGNTAPIIYEDFPAIIDNYVDDYANLRLRFRYLKSLADSDSAQISITNIYDEELVFESDLYDENIIYTEPLDVGTDYKVTISENIDGTVEEYQKLVCVTTAGAEMPDYVTNSETSDSKILIANINDLKASESIDENGEIEIDGTKPRYTKVEASQFGSYVNNLSNNSTYKIYTKDETDKTYTGFITKYADGTVSDIYMPVSNVRAWSDTTSISTYTSSSDITATKIKSASKIQMTHYRDYSFSISSSAFRVYTFQVDYDTRNEPMQMYVRGSGAIGVEIWSASSLTGTPVRKSTMFGRNGTKSIDFIPTGYANPGEYIFFVVYFEDTVGKGFISVMPTEWYGASDVTGSTWEAYQNGGNASLAKTQYYIYDLRDTDAFYINYKSTQKTYRAYLYNDISKGNDACDKNMEITYYTNEDSTFTSGGSPEDVISVPAGKYKSYNFVAGRNMEAFISIYATSESPYSSYYALAYSPR